LILTHSIKPQAITKKGSKKVVRKLSVHNHFTFQKVGVGKLNPYLIQLTSHLVIASISSIPPHLVFAFLERMFFNF
jgi:hypothetical protein